MEDSLFTPPPPSLMHQYHDSHHDREYANRDTYRGLFASNLVLLIVLPLLVLASLAVIAFVVLRVCRRGSKPENISSNNISSYNSSFRKPSFGTNPLSKCGSDLDAKVFINSPDVGSCIYGGKLGFTAMQVRNNKRLGQVFTYKELEAATDGFSESNVIGNGGFGVVFRGRLSDGTVAAIKKLHKEGKQGEREFRTEVDLLSRLNSHHLVGLVGYCADQNHRLLVFEFMSNGSLQQHLHTSSKEQNYRPLDWRTRLRIALDCARGLEFLHEQTAPAVIHRDFKCSNILLDHNYRAKISDFGMAKIGSDKLNGQVLTRVLGTTGYLAPEYASTGRLTTKSDVYSYGVVLLELLTGRSPVETRRPPGEHVLVSWALPRLTNRGKVVEMVDPTLKGQFSTKDLIQVAAIAAVCVQSEADYRPLMTDVVQSLIPLVKNKGAFSCPTTPPKFPQNMLEP
ncbi:probable serine/threonine-protein kinase PBL7 [Ananas comosus]|uniref:non-specific serine/threonine protein kinase n=1 Tax=Ananas comosus TaxID=4615 RepID=A0A6P5GQG8_ANACO|nr:probable serine/threonine-protein kinase PBL7 [Ananas comosus]